MNIPAIDITIKVVVSESAADNPTILDKMADEVDHQLERLDEILSMKFGNDYSHLDVEMD